LTLLDQLGSTLQEFIKNSYFVQKINFQLLPSFVTFVFVPKKIWMFLLVATEQTTQSAYHRHIYFNKVQQGLFFGFWEKCWSGNIQENDIATYFSIHLYFGLNYLLIHIFRWISFKIGNFIQIIFKNWNNLASSYNFSSNLSLTTKRTECVFKPKLLQTITRLKSSYMFIHYQIQSYDPFLNLLDYTLLKFQNKKPYQFQDWSCLNFFKVFPILPKWLDSIFQTFYTKM